MVLDQQEVEDLEPGLGETVHPNRPSPSGNVHLWPSLPLSLLPGGQERIKADLTTKSRTKLQVSVQEPSW